MKTPHRRTRIALAVGGVALAFGAGQAHGAAFGLAEQSGSGLGNAFAGGAAIADDASTVWHNPAGMSRLARPEIAASVHFVTPSIKFHNEGSVAATNQPLGHEGGDAGTLNVVPNLALTMPLAKDWALGLGVNVPFGLVTDYGEGWLGRYQGIKSDVRTINVSPVISWRFAPNFSVGVGANYQRIDATFTSAINYSGALAQAAGQAAAGGLIPAAVIPSIIAATPGLDAKANIDGDDSAWGWNIGLLWDIDKNSRLGVHYRSKIKYDVEGNVRIDKPALPTLPPTLAPIVATLANAVNAQLPDSGVRADIEVPDKANLSYFRMLNDRWDIMADVQWTGWSSIKELKFVRTSGVILQNTPENFKDSWRYSVGANYRYNDQWMFRGGLAYDETPVNDTDRTVRLPDSDRVWLAIGAQYKFAPNMKLDAGFTYIFADNASMNQNAGSTAANGLINGNYDANVTIFSGQFTYTF